MSKKRNWLCFIKTLFFPEALHHQQQKMSQRKNWVFGRQKRAKALPLPPPILQMDKVEAEEKQSNSEEYYKKSQFEEEVQKSPEIIIAKFGFDEQSENDVENLASIKIQSAYRGYLARKALRALKGFVTLQAIIRGRAVRRQAMTTLKCLQAIVNIQSDFCVKRSQMSQIKCKASMFEDFTHEKPMVEPNKPRRDDGLLSKGDEIDLILRKKEAILRRQRTKTFSFNHRHSTDSEDSKTEERLRYWLEQYMNDKELKLKNAVVPNTHHILSLPRRSLQNHRKQISCGEDGFPTYMAATESARARIRSTSSPRVTLSHLDVYSDIDSPYKQRLSLSPMASSINSEVTCSGFSRVSNKSSQCSYYNPLIQQKSPSPRGHFGHVRSSKLQGC